MNQNLLKMAVVCAVTVLVVGGLAAVAVAGFKAGQTQGAASSVRHHRYCDEGMLESLPAALNITAPQLDNFRRITDRAKPELVAIRNDSKQKRRAVMDTAMSEIAGILTPTQQKKLDELQKARQEAHDVRQKLRDALKPSSLFGSGSTGPGIAEGN